MGMGVSCLNYFSPVNEKRCEAAAAAVTAVVDATAARSFNIPPQESRAIFQ